jgi:hypothetical protein
MAFCHHIAVLHSTQKLCQQKLHIFESSQIMKMLNGTSVASISEVCVTVIIELLKIVNMGNFQELYPFAFQFILVNGFTHTHKYIATINTISLPL